MLTQPVLKSPTSTEKLILFDMPDHLENAAAVVEYLLQVLTDGYSDELIRAVVYIAKARHNLVLKIAPGIPGVKNVGGLKI